MSGPRLPDDGAGRGSSRDSPDTVGFAEKLLALLDSGARVTSYKFATLLALIDCCLEYAGGDGLAPTSITTHQLAEKVLELYWPQADVFVPGTAAAAPVVLRQSNTGRAEMITLIRRAREGMRGPRAHTLARFRSGDPDGYAALVAAVEWKLVEMPLPRLQRFGGRLDEFIFHIAWDEGIRKRAMTQDFDNRILLRPGAGDNLLRLTPLLRPLIQREWTREIARWNRSVVEEARLEEFLFGTTRVPTIVLLPELRDIQDNRCFYCGKKTSESCEHALAIHAGWRAESVHRSESEDRAWPTATSLLRSRRAGSPRSWDATSKVTTSRSHRTWPGDRWSSSLLSGCGSNAM